MITRTTLPVIFTIPQDLGGQDAFTASQGITQLSDLLTSALEAKGWALRCGWGAPGAPVIFELSPSAPPVASIVLEDASPTIVSLTGA